MIRIVTSREGAELFKEAMKPLELKDLRPYKRPKLDKEEEMKKFKKLFKNKQ